ncbi:Las1-like-domain-containing protein [Infundibulicybe gibba]|nr:Las1-like-domain-containing protein [Infundibulicybe gibba]
MRLPRRVPWSSLSTWRTITHLPHALESALALLLIIYQDRSNTLTSSLILRQSYATAIIRLVNGLVDPLQIGVYARSIASIAEQLGLPSWLVELRHAATHEDLPSLELLRQAAGESMKWLLHNYFLPTLNPSSAVQSSPASLNSPAPLIKEYKALLKITTRDASLRSHYSNAITAAMKGFERWIAEARVVANISAGEFGWDNSGPIERGEPRDFDLKERWALEKLCDTLIEKGGLVPLSKKKRKFPSHDFSPPTKSVLLWSPLLIHLQALHPNFPFVLSHRIVYSLLHDTTQEVQNDLSYDLCLARWVVWAIKTWDVEDLRSDVDLRKELTVTLIQGLGPSTIRSAADRDTTAAMLLLKTIATENPDLEVVLDLLQPRTRVIEIDFSLGMEGRRYHRNGATPEISVVH